VPTTFTSGPVRVRVPATSANLGPGFDALGLALALHDDVAAEVTPDGVRVAVTGEGAGDLPPDDRHLVVVAMRAAFDLLGAQPPGLALECVNRIPQARGLGSSSAAIVAGVLLARGLVTDGAQRLDDAAVLRLAAEIEGHPDNVAPCLLGGFTVAWTEPTGGRAVSLPVAAGVSPTVFVPAVRGLTATARAALPATVPHGVAGARVDRRSGAAAAGDGRPAAPGLPRGGDANDRRPGQRVACGRCGGRGQWGGPDGAGVHRAARRVRPGNRMGSLAVAGRGARSDARTG
jgi:homoserine kinase